MRPGLPKRLKRSEICGFVDYATIRINQRFGAGGTYDLGSAGGVVRLAYAEKASLAVEGAKAISDPFNGVLGDWRVNVSWRLALGKR